MLCNTCSGVEVWLTIAYRKYVIDACVRTTNTDDDATTQVFWPRDHGRVFWVFGHCGGSTLAEYQGVSCWTPAEVSEKVWSLVCPRAFSSGTPFFPNLKFNPNRNNNQAIKQVV